jgi:hypothetical protein
MNLCVKYREIKKEREKERGRMKKGDFTSIKGLLLLLLSGDFIYNQQTKKSRRNHVP